MCRSVHLVHVNWLHRLDLNLLIRLVNHVQTGAHQQLKSRKLVILTGIAMSFYLSDVIVVTVEGRNLSSSTNDV